MKKNFCYFFIAFCMILSCMFFAKQEASVLYADNTVTGISIALYQSTLASELPLENENGVYSLPFNKNFSDNEQISESNLPYKKYYIGITVQTSPVTFEGLPFAEKVTIYGEILSSFEINGELVEFTSQTAKTDDYEITAYGDYSSRINMSFCSYKSGPMVISCSAGNYSASMTAKCEYAEPSSLDLVTQDSISQLYENFSPIRFTALFNHTKYLDPNAQYTYIWTLDDTTLSVNTNYLQITKEMIKIGSLRLTLEIEELPLLFAQKTLTITTEIGYKVSVTHSGGELTQTIGQNNQPINFVASIPTTENYIISWYLKSSDTNIYQKQKTNGTNFSFNPLAYSAGKFKLFAEAITTETDISIRSDIFVISLETKKAEEQKKFDINCKEYDNAGTSVTAFECSVDAGEYYLEDEIVWSINGIQYAQGSHFNFEPQFADDYVISVRLKNASGTSTNSIAVRAKTVQSTNIWLYAGIAIGVLVIICTFSIIISNKKREKIW